MEKIRAFIPLVLVLLLVACGSQISTTPPAIPSGPEVPDSPYVPSDPITNVPNSPYIGDWAWSASIDGETLFTQGILSVHTADGEGYTNGSWAECYEACPSEPQGLGGFSVNDSYVYIGLYDFFQDEFYAVFAGISNFSVIQKDSQGRNFFEGSGKYTICRDTCNEIDVSFLVTQISEIPTYSPFER